MCLGNVKRKFLSGSGGCNDVCRFIQLGTLTQKMYDLELPDGDSDKPLRDGMSLSDFLCRVREIKPPIWYGNPSDRTNVPGNTLSLPSNCSCQRPHRCTSPRKPSSETSQGGLFGDSAFPAAPGGLFGPASARPPSETPSGGLFGFGVSFGATSSKPLFGEASSKPSDEAPKEEFVDSGAPGNPYRLATPNRASFSTASSSPFSRTPKTPASGGSIFGGSSLFGGTPRTPASGQSLFGDSYLFGSTPRTPTSSESLFGDSSIFGGTPRTPASGESLLGDSYLFGGMPRTPTSSGSLSNGASKLPAADSSIFGSAPRTPDFSELSFGEASSTPTFGGLFGNTPETPVFGGSSGENLSATSCERPSMLEECVQSFIRRVERDMQGLELRKYV
jgi:hypothetical protein